MEVEFGDTPPSGEEGGGAEEVVIVASAVFGDGRAPVEVSLCAEAWTWAAYAARGESSASAFHAGDRALVVCAGFVILAAHTEVAGWAARDDSDDLGGLGGRGVGVHCVAP